jgi:hypothetical protein
VGIERLDQVFQSLGICHGADRARHGGPSRPVPRGARDFFGESTKNAQGLPAQTRELIKNMVARRHGRATPE